jgi:hypothetical protein
MRSACIRRTSTMSVYFLLLTTVEQNGFYMITPLPPHLWPKRFTLVACSEFEICLSFPQYLLPWSAKLNYFACEMNVLITDSNHAYPHLVTSYNVFLPQQTYHINHSYSCNVYRRYNYLMPAGDSKKRTGFNTNERNPRFIPSPVLISQLSGWVHKVLIAPCLKVSWLLAIT